MGFGWGGSWFVVFGFVLGWFVVVFFLNQHLPTFKPNLTSTEVNNLPDTSAGTLTRAQCVIPVPLPMPGRKHQLSSNERLK